MKHISQLITLSLCWLTLFIPINVSAHHSYSIYNFRNKISLTGTITRFDFKAPHIRVDIEVVTDEGETELWEIETTSPVRWNAAGHDKDFVNLQDKMTITGWPTHDGSTKMVLSEFISDEKGSLVIRATRGTNEDYRIRRP